MRITATRRNAEMRRAREARREGRESGESYIVGERRGRAVGDARTEPGRRQGGRPSALAPKLLFFFHKCVALAVMICAGLPGPAQQAHVRMLARSPIKRLRHVPTNGPVVAEPACWRRRAFVELPPVTFMDAQIRRQVEARIREGSNKGSMFCNTLQSSSASARPTFGGGSSYSRKDDISFEAEA